VTASRVFDGQRLIGADAVLIRGEKIVAVGSLQSLRGRAADEVHYNDATILPGVIDTHVHSTAPTIVETGVTTVRALGVPLTQLPRPPDKPGFLRIRSAGPIISVAGGYPTPVWGDAFQLNVSDPASARQAVRRVVGSGGDVIKIAMDTGVTIPSVKRPWPMLSWAAVAAIVTEAHRLGKIVTVHVQEVAVARRLAATDVDEFAHMPCDVSDPVLMRTVARKRIRIVGTLHVEGACPAKRSNARAFVRAGGDLVYGTDVGSPGIPIGLDLTELRQLRAVLGSNGATLESAMSGAAGALGEASLGRIAPGAAADLWIVRGNPLRNLSALHRTQLLLVAGRVAYDPLGRVPD
jgi:imidazolonepropionase-like amidohydrolase